VKKHIADAVREAIVWNKLGREFKGRAQIPPRPSFLVAPAKGGYALEETIPGGDKIVAKPFKTAKEAKAVAEVALAKRTPWAPPPPKTDGKVEVKIKPAKKPRKAAKKPKKAPKAKAAAKRTTKAPKAAKKPAKRKAKKSAKRASKK